MLFKKRFFFISILLHGAVLLLLFSWEVPLANRLFPKNILQVSLVEKIGEKPQTTKAELLNLPKREEDFPNKDEKREDSKEEKREVKREKKEEQKQEQKPEKIEPTPREIKEEKPEEQEKLLLEDWILKVKTEESLEAQTKNRPQSSGGGGSKTSALSFEGIKNPGERTDSSSIFLASAGLAKGKEGISAGEDHKSSNPDRGEGAPLRMSNLPPSSPEKDTILLEILRKIEGAKRYPKLARKMGVEGKATVRFKLKPNGKVESVELLESSGSDLLDKASLETVQQAAPLPYKEGWLKVGIVFKIL
ncbi:MAG: energy transducer TonB [Deltaproteobacteria bacterium]|nr:energy transducer TonB [Deltaproteobacteria bacterium]